MKRRWLRRALVIVALVLSGSVAFQLVATALDERRLPAPGRLHEVAGRSLHLRCLGSGRPTVIIEAGAGTSSVEWLSVQDRMSTRVRTCTYDRVGMGWSEGSNATMTAAAYVADLDELLRTAGEKPPFVLAGHSLGGYLVRLFHQSHRSDVSGIALIDSAHEQQWQRFPAGLLARTGDVLAAMRNAKWLARFAVLRLVQLPTPRLSTDRQNAAADAFLRTTRYWASTRREFEIGMVELPRDVATTGPLGKTPLLVLSAGRSATSYCDGEGGVDCEQVQRTWDVLQAELAALSLDSRHVVVRGATHAMYADAGDEVAEALVSFARSVDARGPATSPR